MGETSKIEWTDATFNPWVGCTKVSPACDNCYAENWARRTGSPELWTGSRRRTSASNWRQPIKWHAAVPDGQRKRVFCASLADVFDNQVPAEWRADLFDMIRATPRLDWLLLTKRIGNVKAMLPPDWGNSVYGYNNVWLGISVINQDEADRDIPKLLSVPARVRFLSCEPLLGPIEFPLPCRGSVFWSGLHWVIVGGESGSHARYLNPDWAQSLVDQCVRADTPVFFKQGSRANWDDFKNFDSFPETLQIRQWPGSQLTSQGNDHGK